MRAKTEGRAEPAILTTLANGLRVVEILGERQGGVGLRELAASVGLPRQTTYRLVRTLVDQRWVSREVATDTYTLTSHLWSLAARSFGLTTLRDALSPLVHRLADEYGETVHLGVYEAGEVLYIDKADGSEPIRAYTQLGGSAPAFCVATGKVLLAFQPEYERERVAGALKMYSERTITDSAILAAELKRIRHRGYAMNVGEFRASVGGIAVAVCDPTGKVVTALGFSGPVERITKRRRDLLDALMAAVDDHPDAIVKLAVPHTLARVARSNGATSS